MIRHFWVVLLLIMFSTNAYADFSDGIDAYKQKDYFTAIKEFRTLAEQGHAEAQTMLGYMYASGKGVIQDYIQAHVWFNLAAAQGNERAFEAREKVAEAMTSEQIAEAQRLAREWTPKESPAEETQETLPSSTGGPEGVALVRAVQEHLAGLGYEPGPADGIMGSKTRWAIRDYQEHAGLRVDGEPSQALLEHLKNAGEARVAEGRSQPETPSPVPNTSPSLAASPSEQTQEVIDRLKTIVQKGEEERSADSRFLAKLRDLIRQYDWPWRERLFRDGFQDGDYTRNPVWNVVSGEFRVDSSQRLVSRFTAPVQEEEPRSNTRQEDTGTRIFKSILTEILKENDEKPSSRPKAPEQAEIYASARITNAFSMDMELLVRSEGTEARIELGVYQGRNRDQGYRLYLIGGATPSLELVRQTARGSSIIEISKSAGVLVDGRPHTLRWQRYPDGAMVVAIDGEAAIQTVDRTFQNAFDGISFINHNGDFAIPSITIDGHAG